MLYFLKMYQIFIGSLNNFGRSDAVMIYWKKYGCICDFMPNSHKKSYRLWKPGGAMLNRQWAWHNMHLVSILKNVKILDLMVISKWSFQFKITVGFCVLFRRRLPSFASDYKVQSREPLSWRPPRATIYTSTSCALEFWERWF